jgi:hypothetical protein
VSAAFNPADVQGNILRGYHKPRLRYLMIEVAEPIAARRWLTASLSGADGVPQITTEEPWETKPDSCFNIGLTYQGLRALGTPAASLATFPTEFIEGMSKRAVKLGDAGPSAPENWDKPFDQPERIHLIASIYADDVARLDSLQRAAMAGVSTAITCTSTIPTTSRNRNSRKFMAPTAIRIGTASRWRRSARCYWATRPISKV